MSLICTNVMTARAKNLSDNKNVSKKVDLAFLLIINSYFAFLEPMNKLLSGFLLSLKAVKFGS